MIASIDDLLNCMENEHLKEHTSHNVELKTDWTQKYGHKISALANKTEYEKTWLVIGVNLLTEDSQTKQISKLDFIGFQPKEIAEILGTTSNTVNVALNRMRKGKPERSLRK